MSVGKFERSPRIVIVFGMSSVDMPIQLVAQKTKLCSLAIASTLLAFTSLLVPNSPCP